MQTISSLDLQTLFAQEVPFTKEGRMNGSNRARAFGLDLLDYIVDGMCGSDPHGTWRRRLHHAAKELRETDVACLHVLNGFLEVLRVFHDDLATEQRLRIAELGFML